jgi:hypothetical protein
LPDESPIASLSKGLTKVYVRHFPFLLAGMMVDKMFAPVTETMGRN